MWAKTGLKVSDKSTGVFCLRLPVSVYVVELRIPVGPETEIVQTERLSFTSLN
jgi:hypothetical protein